MTLNFLKGTGFGPSISYPQMRPSQAAEELVDLKGHGFSSAVSGTVSSSALAAEGRPFGDSSLIQRFSVACSGLPNFRGSSRFLFAILLLLSCLSSRLVAQQSPPTAHELAQRVDHHYNQLHSLKAQFTEDYEGMGRSRIESGTLLLLKPGRMRWDYTSPAGKLFLLDGKYAWFYAKGDPQVQRIGAKQLDDLRSPLRFLLGHTQLEKEIDHLAATPAANGAFTLAGIPHGQEKRVQRLALTVTADGIITAIDIQETDGAETRFTFTGEQPNVPLLPATFQFTPPPGVPIVEALQPM